MATVKNLAITYMDIDQLTPYDGNARMHEDYDVSQIAQSITNYGMADPIAVWGPRNVIVEGHGRLLACRELGIRKVPTIRLDALSDTQRREYAIIHNKTAELSEWDFSALEAELADLDFDGFDIEWDTDDGDEPEDIPPDYKQETHERVRNILNLELGQFEGAGKYDIPEILPLYDMPEVSEWIPFNYVLSDRQPTGKGVHFFIDDYQFERCWAEPARYVQTLRRYRAVLAPDFSPYADMPLATQIYNHYRKHWLARYWQENGVTVIPTIRAAADDRSLEWYLDGEPRGGVVAISAMWTNTAEGREFFLEKEYKIMRETLNPTHVLVYGGKLEIPDTEQIKSFTQGRWEQ